MGLPPISAARVAVAGLTVAAVGTGLALESRVTVERPNGSVTRAGAIGWATIAGASGAMFLADRMSGPLATGAFAGAMFVAFGASAFVARGMSRN